MLEWAVLQDNILAVRLLLRPLRGLASPVDSPDSPDSVACFGSILLDNFLDLCRRPLSSTWNVDIQAALANKVAMGDVALVAGA